MTKMEYEILHQTIKLEEKKFLEIYLLLLMNREKFLLLIIIKIILNKYRLLIGLQLFINYNCRFN